MLHALGAGIAIAMEGGGIGFLAAFIVLTVVSVLVGKDASSRGMSGLLWGLFTFLICAVAVPIYLIVRRPRRDKR